MSQWWFCFLQTCSFQFSRHLQIDWSHGDYLRIIVKFLAAVWILILTAPIHCRGSTGEQVIECNISPSLFQWRNKLIYILGRGLIYFLFILAAFSLQAPLHFCLLLVRLLISSVVESSHLHADFHFERSAKGTSLVTSSQSNTAKLHMSEERRLISSGFFCSAEKRKDISE